MLDWQKEVQNDCLFISLNGDLNIMVTEKFSDFILENSEDINKIIINMDNVNMLDSSGIGKLIYLKKKFDKENKRLYLANVKNFVKEILELGHLDSIFKIIDNDELKKMKQ